MDIRSSGAILRILNIRALADGYLSPNEELLLQSLEKQHRLRAKVVSWEDELEDPQSISCLAKLIAIDYHMLAMRTAVMVASVCRGGDEDSFICEEEERLLNELAGALSLHADDVKQASWPSRLPKITSSFPLVTTVDQFNACNLARIRRYRGSNRGPPALAGWIIG